MLGFLPQEEHVLIGSGGAGDGAADVRRRSRHGSPGFRGEGNRQAQMVGEEVGGGELGKQVVQYIADSAHIAAKLTN